MVTLIPMADRLFDVKKIPTIDEMDPGTLNPRQWESRRDVFFHGTKSSDAQFLQTRREDHPLHLGTRSAAVDRLRGRGSGNVHRFRIADELENTPDKPVSDAQANLAQMKLPDHDDWDPGNWDDYSTTLSSESGGRFRDPHDVPMLERGLYYENQHEDKGSISAVVRRGQTQTRRWSEDVAASPNAPETFRQVARGEQSERLSKEELAWQTRKGYSIPTKIGSDPRLFEELEPDRGKIESKPKYIRGEDLLSNPQFGDPRTGVSRHSSGQLPAQLGEYHDIERWAL